jgi:hypothetical protein
VRFDQKSSLYGHKLFLFLGLRSASFWTLFERCKATLIFLPWERQQFANCGVETLEFARERLRFHYSRNNGRTAAFGICHCPPSHATV